MDLQSIFVHSYINKLTNLTSGNLFISKIVDRLMDRCMDGLLDGWTDGRIDQWTDGPMDQPLTWHWLPRLLIFHLNEWMNKQQNENEKIIIGCFLLLKCLRDRPTNRPTDQPANRRTWPLIEVRGRTERWRLWTRLLVTLPEDKGDTLFAGSLSIGGGDVHGNVG